MFVRTSTHTYRELTHLHTHSTDRPQWAKCAQQAQNFEDSQLIILAAAGQRDNGVDYRQNHQQTIHSIPGRAAVGLLAKHQTVSQDLVLQQQHINSGFFKTI